jgi:hypothetical protein
MNENNYATTMKNTSLILSILFAVLVFSCDKVDDYDFTYETIVTEIPINLEEINSMYDDYNSALPYDGFRHGIYFSTNRKSAGSNFDIIYKEMDISYHSKDDILNISFVAASNTYDTWLDKLEDINSEYDEFGPCPYFGQDAYQYFLFANNESGNFDIKYLASDKGDPSGHNLPKPIKSLNSEFDDLYPCISAEDIYFCSNRETGNFDIYSTIFNEHEINPDFEEVNNNQIEINNILSSSQNDKCPYIFENIIVFASDREGGYGGFDLYYAKKEDGLWTSPKNLGKKVNSSNDEYRPIIVPFFEFEESMIIFSSNRLGGKGGFDLYSVRTSI